MTPTNRLQTLPPGSLILYPFAAPAEQLRAHNQRGHKLIVAHPTPLTLLRLQSELTPLDPARLEDYLLAWGNTPKRHKPLYQHLASLYHSPCPQCDRLSPVDYFVWRRTVSDPQQKFLHCPHCGFRDLSPTTPADLNRLDALPARGLHFHYLLERVAPPHHPARLASEGLHQLYTPRAHVVLAELLMKLDLVVPELAYQQFFKSVLADCLLPGSTLFGELNPPTPPDTLTPPARFIERNLWHLFQQTAQQAIARRKTQAELWAVDLRQVAHPEALLTQHYNALCYLPEPLAQHLASLPDESLLGAGGFWSPPQQALARLEAMWTGWLMGRPATAPVLARLSRETLSSVAAWSQLAHRLETCRPKLKAQARFQLIYPPKLGFEAAGVVLAALNAGFEVEAWEPETGLLLLSPVTASFSRRHPLELRLDLEREARTTLTAIQARQPHLTQAQRWQLVWESCLYSGLLAQTVAVMPLSESWPWLKAALGQILGPPPG